jgi:hypothetical protein
MSLLRTFHFVGAGVSKRRRGGFAGVIIVIVVVGRRHARGEQKINALHTYTMYVYVTGKVRKRVVYTLHSGKVHLIHLNNVTCTLSSVLWIWYEVEKITN